MRHFLQNIKQEVEAGVKEAGQANLMYCPRFVDYFIRQWAPIVPLWTALIFYDVTGQTHTTNQTSEAWFSVLKNTYMTKGGKMELRQVPQ